RASATQLKQDVLFLGPERLYTAPRDPTEPRAATCFIVMPFSEEWSPEVHRILSRTCEAAGVRSVRGDDLFTPTDILEDIWQSLRLRHRRYHRAQSECALRARHRPYPGQARADPFAAGGRHPDRSRHPARDPVRAEDRCLARGACAHPRRGDRENRRGSRNHKPISITNPISTRRKATMNVVATRDLRISPRAPNRARDGHDGDPEMSNHLEGMVGRAGIEPNDTRIFRSRGRSCASHRSPASTAN